MTETKHRTEVVVGRYSTCTLIHADCMDVLPIKCDAVITDPPYGIGFAAQPTTGGRKRGQPRETWDDEAPDKCVLSLLDIAPIVAVWGGQLLQLANVSRLACMEKTGRTAINVKSRTRVDKPRPKLASDRLEHLSHQL